MNNKTNKNKIKLSGVINKILSSNSIIVHLENNTDIDCHLSKRIKKFNLNMIIGDTVDVEISPYDLKRGKITHRYIIKQNQPPK